jgi:SAM-dependent methyltransferase
MNARRPRSLAQRAMEWPPIVRIYESRLWRRSPIAAAAMRISFEREYAIIAAAARLTPAAAVLDLACGPGIYARRFAAAVPQGVVVGLDLSLPMLRFAARRAAAAGLRNLALLRGDAMALPFAAGRFDVVNCCGALHLFPDLAQVLAESARVLAPGGRFTAAAFRRRDGRAAEWATRLRRRRFGVDAFHPDDLSRRLAAAGFGDIRCHHAAGVWLIMSAVRPERASPA